MRVIETRHAVLVRVLGIGVLIEGTPGSGKSLLALELLERGHALIADDVVELRRRGNTLIGTAPPLLHGALEVRGLGTLDVRRAYGAHALCRRARIGLIALLRAPTPRLRRGPMPRVRRHGVTLPAVYLPQMAGHNRTTMLEAACRILHTQAEGFSALAQRQKKLLDPAR